MRGTPRWTAFLPLVVLALAALACGGFQVRVTPPPSPTAKSQPTETVAAPTATVAATSQAAAAVTAGTQTPTAAPTKAGTAASGLLTPGVRARIAVDIVNVRAEAKTGATKAGTLANGTVVTVKGGPVVADNLTWYQVDNGSGLTGWVASGPVDAPWLVPADAGTTPVAPGSGPHLTDRPIKIGDLVQVTTLEDQVLTVRADPSKSAEAVAKVKTGTQFTVRGGPTKQDDLTWWQLEGEQIKGWAADGDGQTRWLTPLE